jgi:uncharacterized membrane protein YccC
VSASGNVRASDQEREQVATEIREHFAQGRLDSEELDERLSLAYAARTRADLEALRHDLPRLPASPAVRKAEVAERRAELSRHLVQQTGGALVPFAVCTLIWLASGANGGFWPIWVILIALIPLLRNGWRLYGPAPDFERVERELRRDHRRRRRLPPGPPGPPPPP